jgi:hypothetical protein
LGHVENASVEWQGQRHCHHQEYQSGDAVEHTRSDSQTQTQPLLQDSHFYNVSPQTCRQHLIEPEAHKMRAQGCGKVEFAAQLTGDVRATQRRSQLRQPEHHHRQHHPADLYALQQCK